MDRRSRRERKARRPTQTEAGLASTASNRRSQTPRSPPSLPTWAACHKVHRRIIGILGRGVHSRLSPISTLSGRRCLQHRPSLEHCALQLPSSPDASSLIAIAQLAPPSWRSPTSEQLHLHLNQRATQYGLLEDLPPLWSHPKSSSHSSLRRGRGRASLIPAPMQ